MTEAKSFDYRSLVQHVVAIAEQGPSSEKASAAIEREIAACGATEREIALAFSTLVIALQDRLKNASPSEVVVCNFCRKSQSEVKMMIQGPTASICDECVVICVETLDARKGFFRRLLDRF